jgi:predicted component of type VI protein secretion system
MAFKLSIEQGKGRGQAFDFDAAAITIGRAEENDVVLYDEQGVSRRHARIFSEDGKFFVEDLGSANGTLLNGTKVAKKESLKDGDTVGIGSVVFLFDSGASQRTDDGSTKIVSLSKGSAPKTDPRAQLPKKPAEKTGDKPAAPAASPRLTISNKAIVIGAVLVLLAAVGLALMTKPAKGNKRASCQDPITYEDAARLVVFGNVNEATCAASKKVAFSFNAEPGMKVLLSYAPFYTRSNEAKVVFNDQKVEDVPPSPTRSGKRRTIELTNVKQGSNVVAFVADNADEWGVERVELQIIKPAEANLEKAEEEYQRGKLLIDRRHVASSNLYNGWLALRGARRGMEGLADKDSLSSYAAVKQMIDTAEQDLDKLCKEQLFRATRQAKYGDYETAHQTYEFLLQAFPGDELPCRYEAQRRMGFVGGGTATASN